MTDTTAYLNAVVLRYQIRMAGMVATNQQRASLGHSMAYVDDAFESLAQDFERELSLMNMGHEAAEIEAWRRQLVCAALQGTLAYSYCNPRWGNHWENGKITENCLVALDIADAIIADNKKRSSKSLSTSEDQLAELLADAKIMLAIFKPPFGGGADAHAETVAWNNLQASIAKVEATQ